MDKIKRSAEGLGGYILGKPIKKDSKTAEPKLQIKDSFRASGKGSSPSKPSGKGSAPSKPNIKPPAGKGSSPSKPSGKGSAPSKPNIKPPAGKGSSPSKPVGKRSSPGSVSASNWHQEGFIANSQVTGAVDSWKDTIK